METIHLYNRYGSDVKLSFVKDNLAILDVPEEEAGWVRVGLIENSTDYKFIDPSGGPFISVGDNFKGKIIKRIFNENNKFYIQFDENN